MALWLHPTESFRTAGNSSGRRHVTKIDLANWIVIRRVLRKRLWLGMLQCWVYRFVKGRFLLHVHHVLWVNVAFVAVLNLDEGCILEIIGCLQAYSGYPSSGLASTQALARGFRLLVQHGSVLDYRRLVSSMVWLPLRCQPLLDANERLYGAAPRPPCARDPVLGTSRSLQFGLLHLWRLGHIVLVAALLCQELPLELVEVLHIRVV